MNWLTNFVLPKIRAVVTRKGVPENLWHKCPGCEQMLFYRELEANLHVCRNCGHHLRIGAALRLLYGVRYTDMGPFRAIRRDALMGLGMRETSYGWNLEMQMRAARNGLRIIELPVAHRCRAGGVSKVSGSLGGTLKASWRILLTFARIALEGRPILPSCAPERR